MQYNPGIYNKKVNIEKPSAQPDEYGHAEGSWETIGTTFASIEPLRGQEYYSALTENSQITARIRMRYRSDIKNEMRITYGNRHFEIISVIVPLEAKKEMQLMVVELI